LVYNTYPGQDKLQIFVFLHSANHRL